jgi:predicted ATP-dependent serine protease
VGRELELNTMTGLLDRAMNGRGSVVGVVGPPGIGKSRLVREVMEIARSRGVYVVPGHRLRSEPYIGFPMLNAASAERYSGLVRQT